MVKNTVTTGNAWSCCFVPRYKQFYLLEILHHRCKGQHRKGLVMFLIVP